MSRKTYKTSATSNEAASKAVKNAAASATASMFEALEDRKLFSVLTINGTAGDDVIRLSQRGPLVTVSLNQSVKSYRAMRIDGVVVNGLDGNDVIRPVAAFNIPLTLNGGAGNDQLAGGRGADHLNGGDGNDFLFPSPNADDFDGGAGVDTADYSTYTAAINVTLDDAANDGAAGESDNVHSTVENVTGGYGNDTITGSAADNYLQGAGGTDTIYGMGGNDTLDGGIGGAFPVSRNNGNDVLYGGPGADALHASDYGDCTLNGEAGNDTIFGYGGDDTLDGGPGADNEYGGAGNDVIYGGTGDDNLDGQEGNDTVYGSYGPRAAIYYLNPFPVVNLASVTDGTSNTLMLGEAGAISPIDTTLPIQPIVPIINPRPIDLQPISPINPYVLPPIDVTPLPPQIDPRLIDPVLKLPPIIFAETDNDIIHGGVGDDRLRGDGGNDQVFGDAGNDFCYGDAGDDVVHGGDDADHLYGGAGADQLYGDNGDDVLVSIGGGQSDYNNGGDGFDSVWCDAESTEVDDVPGFFDALFEGAGGNHHRVGGFEAVTNGASSQTPTRELNGQNLIDPRPMNNESFKNFSDRPLFGSGGPHKDDVHQGGLADCYFLAGLSAIAKQNPNRIGQSVVDLGDGTYAVQFFSGSTQQFYRVDGDLPATTWGSPAYQQLGHDDALWVSIMEKAFAFRRTGAGTYSSIEYGGTEAFTTLNLTNSGIARPDAVTALENIKARLDNHEAVITWTPKQSDIPSDCPCVGSHMYSVERVDLQHVNILGFDFVVGGTIVVRNPWHTDGGGNSDGSNDGYVTLTADQYFRGFAGAWSANA